MSRKVVLTLCLAFLATVTAHAQRPLGIDVSSFQSNNINWASVKSGGYTFAWAKATEGTFYVDADFAVNQANARSAGVLIGAYHFAHPESYTPAQEATYFWNTAGSYVKADGQSLMPMLDYETFPGGVVGASTYADWANLWCSNVIKLAAAQGVVVTPVIYISACNTPEISSENSGTIPWIANYNGQSPSTGSPWGGVSCTENEVWGSGVWDLWQYSSSVTVPGVSTGPCDVDVFNGTASTLISTLLIGTIQLTGQPANVNVPLGGTATFNVTVGGSGTFKYQWRFNQSSIPNATTNVYSITNVQLSNAGAYSVAVTNAVGSNVLSGSAFLSVFAPLTNAPTSPLDPANMVNWWTGDGNFSDIYGVTNLTPSGNVSYTNGEEELAFRLDGSSAYMTSKGGEIAPPWTACLWLYRQSASHVSAAIFGDGTYAIKSEQYSNAVNSHAIGISHSSVADYLFTPPYSAPANKWTHLAFEAIGTNVMLYTNGVLEGSVAASSAFNLPRAFIGVDTFSGSPSDFMLGGLDEVQVFTRALSAAEISSIYNAGSNGIVRAPQFTSISTNGNGQIQLNLIGQTGKAIILNSSTNLLTNWTPFGTNANQFGITNYTDPDSSEPAKFYQATQKY